MICDCYCPKCQTEYQIFNYKGVTENQGKGYYFFGDKLIKVCKRCIKKQQVDNNEN